VGCRNAEAEPAGPIHRTRWAEWPRCVAARRPSRVLYATMLSCGELGAIALYVAPLVGLVIGREP